MTTRLWETDDEYSAATHAGLPTPTDTPYRTPSRTSRASRTSRRSKRSSNSPPASSSPPPMPYGDMQNHRNSRDIANDESISILDPRRFTPTLHASLVSEILGLRRDQEEKTKFIESLEIELHEARGVHENLEQTISTTGKETRSLKRQLALLEGGTSSALQELAKDRDEAVENAADIKRRLESVQKKQRSQEEDLDRTNELYSRDKENWENERRKYERQIHVAEGRLKTVLDEVAAFQVAQEEDAANRTAELTNGHENGETDNENDNGSVRSMSITHSRKNSRAESIRFSLMNGFGNGFKGVSLADELNLETDDDQETDSGGRESVMSNHKRHQSRDSIISLKKNHMRNKSTDSMIRSKSQNRNRFLPSHGAFADFDGGIPEEAPVPPKPEYVDTGIQFSPPSSPKLEPIVEPIFSTSIPDTNKIEHASVTEPAPRESEVEANQRRKRVHAPLIFEPKPISVSSGCQTLEPLSPPRTPESPSRAPPPPPGMEPVSKSRTASISTQTDPPPSPTRPAPQAPLSVPMISIHPPESRPHTPKGAVLPVHFKDASCQAFLPSPRSYCSSSMQTEEIRVDKRLGKLPPHLHPSSISSVPPTPERRDRRFSPVPGNIAPIPPKSPRRATSQSSNLSHDIPSSPPISALQQTYDAYPGNNDDGPLSKERLSSIRRPHRVSSLFAGFDDKSSDDGDFAEGEMSDSDFRTVLSAPNMKKEKRTTSPTSVHEDNVLGAKDPANRSTSRLSSTSGRRSSKGSSQIFVSTAKQGTMRKAALISSGVAAHVGAPNLEGENQDSVPPPFPIPTRASSRQPPNSFSAPTDGQRSPTPGDSMSNRHARQSARGHSRSNSIRKVRSAAALQRNGAKYRRQGSGSPPPHSVSTEDPTSPQLPPMPSNGITSPSPRFINEYSRKKTSYHGRQPSSNTACTEATGGLSNSSSQQATSVVDSIAQTMVGEWMFKYVRRRKSFGVTDNNQIDDTSGNGVRHKRWVWLAPYERAVMWSSKQPTSGSALLGKSGRKLTIQSVLDVKDENPGPKNAGGQTVFNRSILILTPARALKFTAANSERHYIWLTALSFLAHSSQAAVPNIQVPPLPTAAPPFEIPMKSMARLRKNPIRDSIRVAKGKVSPGPHNQNGVNGNGRYNGSAQGDNMSSLRSPALTDISFASSQPQHARDDSAFSGVAIPRYGGRGERSLNTNGDYLDHIDRGYQSSYPTTTHSRKRSHTAPRIPPPLSFRGLSGPSTMTGPATSTSSQFPAPLSATTSSSQHTHAPGLSINTNVSSDIYSIGEGRNGAGTSTGTGTGYAPTYQSSIRTSDISTSTRPNGPNFFDAVGTVRMEAFISPMALLPTGNIGRFDDYMNEDPALEGMATVGFGNNNRAASDKSWGDGDHHGDRERERNARRRKNRQREGYYGNRLKMSGGVGPGGPGRREEVGSRTAGEEDFVRDVREGGLSSPRSPREFDPFRGF